MVGTERNAVEFSSKEIAGRITRGGDRGGFRHRIGCHQIGNLATRTLPKGLGEFKTSEEAWTRRVQSGQAGLNMVNVIAGELNSAPIKYFADWTDRIAAGELPHAKPQRPQGIERNVVITTWDWADAKHYLHDEISTDKRNPTVNPYGPLFGSPEYATDIIPILALAIRPATRRTVRGAAIQIDAAGKAQHPMANTKARLVAAGRVPNDARTDRVVLADGCTERQSRRAAVQRAPAHAAARLRL
jgi:hypothetical protein